ncbi:MAG: hypothetical protein M1832_003487 [Thelocarpon impressellum]|nr:MAG: hypothetical protein M1832_003487 [Thelocarpon impressellum]
MPRSLAKVHKKISKKRGNINSLNENSRDSQRLRRAGMRDGKLARVLAARIKSNQPLLQRVAFFQKAIEDASGPPTSEDLHDLINKYIHRDGEELSKLQADRRPGRPASLREDGLTQRTAAEEREHETGFYLPDLRDEKNAEILKRWNGEWAYLTSVKFVRLDTTGGRQEASFPPKGA